MKKTYFVCAQVLVKKTSETDTGKRIINTKVSINVKETSGTKGSIAEKLKDSIPFCDAILNFWEYSYD